MSVYIFNFFSLQNERKSKTKNCYYCLKQLLLQPPGYLQSYLQLLHLGELVVSPIAPFGAHPILPVHRHIDLLLLEYAILICFSSMSVYIIVQQIQYFAPLTLNLGSTV